MSLSYRAVKSGYSVSCDGRVVGHIRIARTGGCRYVPLGAKATGPVFETLADCKRSLTAA